METKWAAERLQVIRTLMERSALYRRALAPVMLLAGAMGVLGAVAGWFIPIELPQSFAAYWLGIAIVTVAAVCLLMRRQALQAAEPFWSPPARRIAQGFLPATLAGLLITVAACFVMGTTRLQESMTLYATGLAAFVWLPALWMVLYGCALHAAGFFLPRGIKLFGYLLLLGGCGLFWITGHQAPTSRTGHLLMGAFFGALHLAYGIYLSFTEKRPETA